VRKYQVLLRGSTQFVEIQADDVNLDSGPGAAFWNFLVSSDSDDAVTVAAFPYTNADYIVSVS
jgi:hypothetical protein